MERRISVQIALFLVLLCAVALSILPILGLSPLTYFENGVLNLANTIQSTTFGDILRETEFYDRITVIYAFIVSLLITPESSAEATSFLLRLPSAVIMIILILSLYRFDGMIERLNNSFLASMLFLSCCFISVITFHASPISIPAIFLILSLICLYHWIRRRSRKYIFMLILSTSVTTMLLGAVAPIFIFIMAAIFLGTTRVGNIRNWIIIIVSLLLSCAITSAVVYAISSSADLATSIFSIQSTLSYIATENMDFAHTLINYILVAAFPWSVPLVISSFWLLRKPRWVIEKFESLKLLQRFAIVLFLVSLPSFFFFSNISVILIIACIFFNMPLIANYMLLQQRHHPTVLKITGIITGSIVGIGLALYLLLNNGIEIAVFGVRISMISQIWNVWNISVIVSLYISLYSLWRNTRYIERNNRYLYNIIVLYLLAQVFYMGFINHNIAIS